MNVSLKHMSAAAGFAIAAIAGLAPVSQAGSGAIYTTFSDGTVVNENTHYTSKEEVYLNGGPQNEAAAGLDDGIYYFQVTDPSGDHLLSTDNAENRQVTVTGGRIVGAAGVTPHATGPSNPANGVTPVQLAPFADTPNTGGEYKAWLIGPVVVTVRKGVTTSNVTISPTDPRVLVFNNSDAKTDNFKIRAVIVDPPASPVITIGGVKYYDLNANGFRDTGEIGVPLFRIEVTFALSDNSTIVRAATTDATGAWEVITPNATEMPTGVTVVGFTAAEVQPSPNADGSYWMQTGPLLGDETANPHVVLDNLQDYCWTGSLIGRTTSVTGIDFGNICVRQPAGGFTLGYWSNKNGEAVLKANDPAWRTLLNGMNLCRADGTAYDVPGTLFGAAYKDFRAWDLGATATNMAYMLSVQLSATTLDTTYKGLAAATLVYLPSENAMQVNLAELYGANVVGIGTIIAEANADLGTPGHENTTAPSGMRDHQECLKNILDNINNNKLLFVAPVPGMVTYPQ